MDKKYQILVIVAVILFEMIFFVRHSIIKGKRESPDEVYQKGKSPPALYRDLYRVLASGIVTKNYVAKVRHRFEMVEPGDIEKIEADTVKSILALWGTTLAIVIAALLYGITLYSFLLVVYSIYIFSHEFVDKSIILKQNTLLEQLHVELENLQNNYNMEGNVPEAIYKTSVNAPKPVADHLKKIWEILQKDWGEMDAEIEKYNISAPNTFLKDVLACSKEIYKYGDGKVNGISNYSKKITMINNAVAAEIRKDMEWKNSFSGHAGVCIFPVYLIALCHMIASKMSEVAVYYKGTYGVLSLLACFAVSVAAYAYISQKKDMNYVRIQFHPYLQQFYELPVIRQLVLHYSNRDMYKRTRLQKQIHGAGESLTVEQFYTQRIIFFVIACILAVIVSIGITISNRGSILQDSSNVSVKITEGTSEEEEQAQLDYLTQMSFDLEGGKMNQETLIQDIKDSGLFFTEKARNLALEEIQRRVKAYRNAYFHWYYLVYGLIAGCAASFVPYFLIGKNAELVQLKTNEEVLRFQNIISCMKHIDRAGTKETLQEMELSADIYRNSVTDCLDEYASDPMKALTHFKQREKDNAMIQNIVTKFERADRVGIHDAFENLDAEIEEAIKSKEVKLLEYIRGTANVTYMVAFLPFAAVLILEMLLPMLMSMMTKMALLN